MSSETIGLWGQKIHRNREGEKIMITIIAMFELKPECVDTFKGLAAECIEASRKEEGMLITGFMLERKTRTSISL